MFGLACALCWERDCHCTHEELEEYKKASKKIVQEPLEYTKTKPHVTKGDPVYKNGVDFYVTKVEDGVGYIKHYSHFAELCTVRELVEPYMVVKAMSQQRS